MSKSYTNNQAGTGFKKKWEDTIGVNVRVPVSHYATVVKWLESNGNILKTSSDVIRHTFSNLFYVLPKEERVEDLVEAYKIITSRGLVQGKEVPRIDERTAQLILLSSNLSKAETEEEKAGEELAKRIAERFSSPSNQKGS